MADDRSARFNTMLDQLNKRFLIGVEGLRELWLIRHADAYHGLDDIGSGELDPPLSARGRRQAERLAARLAAVGIHQVWSSDLWRARETAAHLATVRPEIEIRIEPRLREARTHWDEGGAAELGEPGSYPFPEPFGEVAERMDAAVREILGGLPPGDRAAAVSHSAAISIYIAHLLGLRYGQLHILPQFTSVSVVVSDGDRVVVQSIADITHLAVEHSD